MVDTQKTKADLAKENISLKERILTLEAALGKMPEGEHIGKDDLSYQKFLNSLNAGVVVHTQDTAIIYANPTACQLLGLSEKNMEGKLASDPAWKFFNEDKTDMALEDYPVNRILSTNSNLKNMHMAVKPPLVDDLVWLLVNGYSVKDAQGEIDQVVINFIDISERKQLDEEMARSENKFRTVVDTSPFPITVADKDDQNIFFWSTSAQKLFGHNPKTTEEWYQLAYPDPEYRREVIERWKPFLEKAQDSTAAVNTGEYNITCKDGTVKICELFAQFIDESLIVTLHDVTKRKRAEAKLAQNQILLTQSQSAGKLGGFSFDVNTLEQTWTKETFNILEIESDDDAPKVPEGINFIAPEYQAMANEAIQKAIEEGKEYDQEWEVITAKKNRKWVRSIGKPVFEERVVTNITGSLQDITEVKLAQSALAESEQKFRALYDNAPLSFQSLDEEGCFLDINPAWLSTLGYEKEAVLGTYFGDFLHPEWKPHFEENFPAFKKRGYVSDVHFKIRHQDGHYLDISFEGCIGYHPDGSFKQTYCVFQDITLRMEAEETLKSNQKKLEHLVAERTKDLEIKNRELAQAMRVFVGRETKILELQKKIDALKGI